MIHRDEVRHLLEDENSEVFKSVVDALGKAIKTFYKELEKNGIEGAYFPMSITIYEIDVNFEYVLEKLKWTNLEHSIKEEVE